MSTKDPHGITVKRNPNRAQGGWVVVRNFTIILHGSRSLCLDYAASLRAALAAAGVSP